MAGGPGFLRPEDELTVRLCFVNFDGVKALCESKNVGDTEPLPDDFVQNHCTPVHDGIQVGSWFLISITQLSVLVSILSNGTLYTHIINTQYIATKQSVMRRLLGQLLIYIYRIWRLNLTFTSHIVIIFQFGLLCLSICLSNSSI